MALCSTQHLAALSFVTLQYLAASYLSSAPNCLLANCLQMANFSSLCNFESGSPNSAKTKNYCINISILK